MASVLGGGWVLLFLHLALAPLPLATAWPLSRGRLVAAQPWMPVEGRVRPMQSFWDRDGDLPWRDDDEDEDEDSLAALAAIAGVGSPEEIRRLEEADAWKREKDQERRDRAKQAGEAARKRAEAGDSGFDDGGSITRLDYDEL
uniref:Uncharacterized protein n=1 Tax=Rhizochromulina marina TaxID=1034831 RepID=A0A7S2W1X5_9STRA|mmetsp:Transcript_1127/g.3608  ORF Transcript_1127/g.3608 Transcript_1127/m.3608 type:complete len:143 (+) Transcript_1127:76-504(+)